MNHPRRPFPRVFCVAIGLFAGAIANAQSRAQSGVDVQIGSATVEAAAATNGAFRLTVSYNGKPEPAKSIYLAPNPAETHWTPVNENGWTGVKTTAGELLIHPADALWTLRDAHGKTLIPPGPIGQITHNQQTGNPFIILNAGCTSDRPFEVYGCGDGADSLLQDHARPSLGNGHAVVPYYWSRAGYAALGVSADDNAPPPGPPHARSAESVGFSPEIPRICTSCRP